MRSAACDRPFLGGKPVDLWGIRCGNALFSEAVVERSDKFYCLVRDPQGKLAAREVLIGSTNEKFLVIREGLNEGQEVVMNPRAHLEEVGLPAVDIEKRICELRHLPVCL